MLLKRAFSPQEYKKIIDFQILKKAGIYEVEIMRTIQFVAVVIGINNKKIEREVIQRAEDLPLIPDEQ